MNAGDGGNNEKCTALGHQSDLVATSSMNAML
jgi:hypothetical protein